MSERIVDESAYVRELIERIVRDCPRRQPTSGDERRAQEIMDGELARLGLPTRMEPFQFNDNLYANILLHFGLGTLGTAISGLFPLGGLLLHLAAGGSYYLDSTRKAYLLRRLLGFRPSQNLLAVRKARRLVDGQPALRVVVAAHADAAFTGLLFQPIVVRALAGKKLPPPLDQPMAAATRTQLALAACDLARLLLGPLALPLRPLEAALTLPGLLAFLTNLEIVLRDRIVPGANDDLSGVAALPVLAARLADAPDDVELVFAVTGCEEASMGGADALARAHRHDWDRSRTVFLALDGLTGGELRYLETEGEVCPLPVPPWLVEEVDRARAADPRFASVKGHVAPVGGTDAQAFLAHGYPAISLVCVDPAVGSPAHYHLPTDTPENLDMDRLMTSIDFAERLLRGILDRPRA